MKKVMFIFLFCCFSYFSYADTWMDPSWKEMIDSSEVIALVRYTTSGAYKSKARILKVYKGSTKSKTIYISGFSGRHGPIQYNIAGTRAVVFLNQNNPNWYSTSDIKETPFYKLKLKAFYKKAIQGKAYHVWTPTSGDYKIKGRKAKFNLLYTTQYRDIKKNSFRELDQLLVAIHSNDRSIYHKQIIQKIKTHENDLLNSQYLMMLYLSAYNKIDSSFYKIIEKKGFMSNWALAILLGSITSNETRDLLIQILNHNNSIVQGEAVRQLAQYDADYIGPILLDKLEQASHLGIYPSGFMNPLRNVTHGARIQIIKTLGEIGYKPAGERLAPLLLTNNENELRTIVISLEQLNSKAHVKYINKHLKDLNYDIIYEIVELIDYYKLEDCRSGLMHFITNHNRSKFRDYTYTMGPYSGISLFKDDETIEFILKDIQSFLSNSDTVNSKNRYQWYSDYITTLTKLNAEKGKSSIYDIIYDWSGIHRNFGCYPRLYQIKDSLEREASDKFNSHLKDTDFKLNNVIAYIQNTDSVIKGKSPETKFRIEIIITEPSKDTQQKDSICKLLSIPPSDVYIKYPDNYYDPERDIMFDEDYRYGLFYRLADFIKIFTTQEDLEFLIAFEQSGYIQKDLVKKRFNKEIEECR